MELSVVIPTFNEAGRIEALLAEVTQALEGIDFEVWVVDDDSPDLTWRLVEDFPDRRVHCLRRIGEKGLATAVIAGWKKASGKYLAVIDGDGQHPPEALRRLYERMAAGGVDLTCGTRRAAGGSDGEWSLSRSLASRAAAALARVLFPRLLRCVSDPMSGMFCIDRRLIEGQALSPAGYKILLEVVVRCQPARIAEVPYVFHPRREGASKAGTRQAWLYLKHLVKLRLRSEKQVVKASRVWNGHGSSEPRL
jgi:dolichol-phosphate mannosyltransferase